MIFNDKKEMWTSLTNLFVFLSDVLRIVSVDWMYRLCIVCVYSLHRLCTLSFSLRYLRRCTAVASTLISSQSLHYIIAGVRLHEKKCLVCGESTCNV